VQAMVKKHIYNNW